MPDEKEVAALAEKIKAESDRLYKLNSIGRRITDNEFYESYARVALEFCAERRDEDREERLRLKEEIRMIREREEPPCPTK